MSFPLSLDELRRYRLDIESYPFFNNKNQGIALFDLIISFIVAFILESYLLPYIKCKDKRLVYYLLIIPLGILVHHIIAHYRSGWKMFPEEITFLNKKIFSLELNIYKVLLVIMLYAIVTRCV